MTYIKVKDLKRFGLTDWDIVMLTQDPTAAKLVIGEGRRGEGVIPAEHGDLRGSLCMCEHFYLQIQDHCILEALASRAREKNLSLSREGFFVKVEESQCI